MIEGRFESLDGPDRDHIVQPPSRGPMWIRRYSYYYYLIRIRHDTGFAFAYYKKILHLDSHISHYARVFPTRKGLLDLSVRPVFDVQPLLNKMHRFELSTNRFP